MKSWSIAIAMSALAWGLTPSIARAGELGACCFSNGLCFVQSETDCVSGDGAYQGAGTDCNTIQCPPPMGACCDGLFGGCTLKIEADCLEGNLEEWQGPGTTCEFAGCGEVGACCRPSDGACFQRGQVWCDLVSWNFTGEGIACDPNMCPQPPRGACCQESGECQPDLAESECVNQTSGGVWAGADTVCEPENPCPQPAVGACCFPTSGCLVVPENICFDAFGNFQGEGTTCLPSPCTGNEMLGFCDDFDDYTDGELLYNVNGWSGWDGIQGNAGSASSAQAFSPPNSIDAGGNKDVIHPFDPVFAGGQWEITIMQYLPSTLDNTSYFIVNSFYADGGPYFFPVEIQFNPVTGQVHDALRDESVAEPLSIVYDQWVEIRIEADFENDWPGDIQSAGTIRQFYNGQLLKEGSWIPIESGTITVGQLAIANIDLWTPHATAVFYDDLCVLPVSESDLNPQRPLIVGTSETSLGLPTRTTNLDGEPNVTWTAGYNTTVAFEGAAGRPDGAVYIAGTEDGSFRPNLFIAPFAGPPVPLCEFGTSFTAGPSGLAYGRGKLYGYFNFATPKGIYEIDPATCDKTLVVDTGSFRYFALDYNAVDGLLYGYTGFGSPTGLYSIDPDTGVQTFIAPTTPASNSSANAMAIGKNTVYLAGTRGADGVPMYTYDLSQGTNGSWVEFTQAFPESNAQAGAAYAPGPVAGDTNCDGKINGADIQGLATALVDGAAYEAQYIDCTILNADVNQDGSYNDMDIVEFVALLMGN